MRRFSLWGIALCLADPSFAASNERIDIWSRFETQFVATGKYANPVQDASLAVEFKAPNGTTYTVAGFWDGGSVWRVRFSPNEIGKWTWRTASRPDDPGLSGKQGSFTCVKYRGGNPLYQRGPIRVAASRYHLEYADGTPFLWLGDTAWSGPLKSTAAAFGAYLKDRQSKGFNLIQFITTHWTAGPADSDGQLPYSGEERIEINPAYFQRLDQRFDAINEHGMVAAPILLWSHGPQVNPLMKLSDSQLSVLARYMVARYGAHQVIWLLNGDGNYLGQHASRWKKLGREILAASHPDRIAGMHPAGRSWTQDEFITEPWYSFTGYQSGHRMDAEGAKWDTSGPPSQAWRQEPHCPIINLEPNYEGHNNVARGASHVFNAKDVRRAFYWSLLVSPPAGVTYGGHGIWSWETAPGEPLNHRGTGIARPWSEAINLPGSNTVKYVKDLFTGIPWWRLRPANEVLVEQPGRDDPFLFVAVAVSDDGRFSLAYTPAGGTLRLKSERPGIARWYNPSNGQWTSGETFAPGVTGFSAPDGNDWVLWRGFSR